MVNLLNDTMEATNQIITVEQQEELERVQSILNNVPFDWIQNEETKNKLKTAQEKNSKLLQKLAEIREDDVLRTTSGEMFKYIEEKYQNIATYNEEESMQTWVNQIEKEFGVSLDNAIYVEAISPYLHRDTFTSLEQIFAENKYEHENRKIILRKYRQAVAIHLLRGKSKKEKKNMEANVTNIPLDSYVENLLRHTEIPDIRTHENIDINNTLTSLSLAIQ